MQLRRRWGAKQNILKIDISSLEIEISSVIDEISTFKSWDLKI